jgi:hypothetical protein
LKEKLESNLSFSFLTNTKYLANTTNPQSLESINFYVKIYKECIALKKSTSLELNYTKYGENGEIEDIFCPVTFDG